MRPVHLAEQVAWAADDAGVYAARVPQGPPFVLQASAAAIWLAVAEFPDTPDLVGILSKELGLSDAAIRYDVESFVASLVEAGIFVEA